MLPIHFERTTHSWHCIKQSSKCRHSTLICILAGSMGKHGISLTINEMQSDFKYKVMLTSLCEKSVWTVASLCNVEFLILNQIEPNPDRNNQINSSMKKLHEWTAANGLHQSSAVLWPLWIEQCANCICECVCVSFTLSSRNATY